MKTLAQLREDVWDRLDSDENDNFFPASRVTSALNSALAEAVDKLAITVARRRWMKRIANLEADADFDDATLTWSLPADFRRPFLLIRDQTRIKEIVDEHKFDGAGADAYMVIGRELILTEETDPTDLKVYYVYGPAKLVDDEDEPDWIEGYEEYLVCRAAATLAGKADTGDPQVHIDEAGRLWGGLQFAARNSAMPGNIRRDRDPYEEDWM